MVSRDRTSTGVLSGPCHHFSPCSLTRVTTPTPLTVRTITTAEHAAYVAAQPSASFLQTPGWAQVKPEWRAESLGWFRDGEDAGRRRAGALPPAPPAQALPRLPPRGTGHRLDHRGPRLVARADDRPPVPAGRLRRPDGPARGHPPLERRPGQGGHRRRVRAPADGRAPARAQPDRRLRRVPAPRARLASAGRRGRLRGRPAAVQLRHPARPRRRHPAHRGRGPRRDEPAVAAQHQEGRQAGRRRRARHPRGPQGLPRPLRAHRRARPLHPARPALLRDDVRRPVGRGGRAHHRCGPPATRATSSPARSRSGSAPTPGTPTAPAPPRSATSAAPTRSSGR